MKLSCIIENLDAINVIGAFTEGPVHILFVLYFIIIRVLILFMLYFIIIIRLIRSRRQHVDIMVLFGAAPVP